MSRALTAREHLATAYIHLCAALAATNEPSYQQGAEPAIPVGAVQRAIEKLQPYSRVPETR